tara:strand:+ start:1981 stop:2955 length:975 start_codon:yes stop_codon:yes gene_type:complete
MTVVMGRGECGSHVTLIFTVDDGQKEIMSQGSLGAGLCLERGVETIARGIEGDFKLDIKFVEGIGIKNLYQRTLELLSEQITSVREYSWDLAVKLKLPLSQGFGMSASGAISAAMAFQRALGEPNEESLRRAFAIAHRVERELSTGLGDVTALAAGGVERRTSPGSPFSGKLLNRGPGKSEGWTQEIEVILTWKEDSGKHTSSYIDNQKWKESISSAGIKQMNQLVNGKWEVSRWEELLERSEVFVNESGLLNDSLRLELLNEVDDIIDRLNLNLKPLLCLLGKSLVIVPKEIGAGNVINSESLINHLKDAGFSAVKTKIGKLF